MLGQDSCRSRVRPRLDIDRPQVLIVDILQCHRHDLGLTVDVDTTKELQPEARSKIFALLRAAALLEHRRRPNGIFNSPGTHVPPLSRPDTDFQNGSNAWNTTR